MRVPVSFGRTSLAIDVARAFANLGEMILRRAEPKDAIGVSRVHVRAWQAGYRALLPDDYLEQLRPEHRAQKYDFDTTDPSRPQTIVAEEEGVILGFATTVPARDAQAVGSGELSALHVDPEQWGRGIGVALISAARNRLVADGFQDAIVWVLSGNVRALRFYMKDGWLADGISRTDVVWGLQVQEIRYRRALATS